MKDKANTRLYTPVYPGIFLAGNRLFWNGTECRLHNEVFETPVGELSIEKMRTLLEIDICLPPKLWPKVRLEYLDDDSSNNAPDNVVMMFPPGGLEMEDKPGYFYVPGFTRYAVSRFGDVYNWRMDLQMSPYLAEVGYWMFGMTRDCGKRTIIGTHRVLALAFLQFNKNVKKLDVNHKNGIKIDNDLDNLEWSTRSQNCYHAYENGLRDENIVVEVKSIYTGEVVSFFSIAEAARQMNVSHACIAARINSAGQAVYSPGVLVRRRDCGVTWMDLQAFDLDLTNIGKVSRIVLTSDTLKITADTYFDASAVTGIDAKTIRWRFHHWQQPIPLGNFTGRFESLERDCKSLFAVMQGSNIS